MNEMQVYALKGDPDWAKEVFTSLQEGVGRFGWSYMGDDDGRPLGGRPQTAQVESRHYRLELAYER
jgi:hypothetical protein